MVIKYSFILISFSRPPATLTQQDEEKCFKYIIRIVPIIEDEKNLSKIEWNALTKTYDKLEPYENHQFQTHHDALEHDENQ